MMFRHYLCALSIAGWLVPPAGCSDGNPGTNNNSYCGDGIRRSEESCDGSDLGTASCASLDYVGGHLACASDCTFDTSGCFEVWPCGDGVVNPGEECDDGNTVAGDGCDGGCQIERGWSCDAQPSTCVTTCSDAILAGAEECDDGNLRSHDGCSSGCTAEHPIWEQVQTANAPPERTGFGLAFDPLRAVTVLFGGYYADPPDEYLLGDTWEYDGTDWAQVTPSASPPDRSFHAMAHNTTTGRMVVFGGATNGSLSSKTWVYDGTMWWDLAPAMSPPGLAETAMAYDVARGVIVLFGGRGVGSPPHVTWEFNGDSWTDVLSPEMPDARSDHSLAYDGLQERIVLHGGAGAYLAYNDVWAYDGQAWTELVPNDLNSPNARMNTALVYDARCSRIVRFGGWTFNGGSRVLRGDMHLLDGERWVELVPENPPPARAEHQMVFDTVRQEVVLFGGWTEAGRDSSTWEYRWDSDWPDEVCDNTVDDDSDGLADCVDPDCSGHPSC